MRSCDSIKPQTIVLEAVLVSDLSLSLRLTLMLTLSMVLIVIKKYLSVATRIKNFNTHLCSLFITTCESLILYYKMNDLLWQDGLLIDFVQKKVVDKWIRKFLISSSYLFSERVLFTFVVKFYNNLIVWTSTVAVVFEFSNTAFMLKFITLPIFSLLIICNLGYLFIWLF